MKSFLLLLHCFCFVTLTAQIETRSGNGLLMPTESSGDRNTTNSGLSVPKGDAGYSKSSNGFSIKSRFDENVLSTKVDRTGTLKNADLNTYTTNDKPKAFTGKDEGNVDISKFQKDQYFGEFMTKSKYVILRYRDHGMVDGDIIGLYKEDVEIRDQIYLNGTFKEEKIFLGSGFNRIDVKAMNNGQMAPNTGHFIFIDDRGKVIFDQQWQLAAGFKATFLMIKE